jgi:hypothetical protein
MNDKMVITIVLAIQTMIEVEARQYTRQYKLFYDQECPDYYESV